MYKRQTSIGETFFGARNRQTLAGIEYEQVKLAPELANRLKSVHERLDDLWRELKY